MAGEGKGNGDGGKTGSATRMVTRLRNPDSKLSQRKVMQDKDGGSQDSKALKEVKIQCLLLTQKTHLSYSNKTNPMSNVTEQSVLFSFSVFYFCKMFSKKFHIWLHLILSLDSSAFQLGQEGPRPEDRLWQWLLQTRPRGQIPRLPQPVQHKCSGT